MDQKLEQGRRILRCARIGKITCRIAEKLEITPLEALKLFYKSETCRKFHDRKSRLYLYGDLYVANDYLSEIGHGFEKG